MRHDSLEDHVNCTILSEINWRLHPLDPFDCVRNPTKPHLVAIFILLGLNTCPMQEGRQDQRGFAGRAILSFSACFV